MTHGMNIVKSRFRVVTHRVNQRECGMFSYPTLAANDRIGERILALRRALGLTQAQFAERVGASRSRVNNWEAGTRRPDLDAAIRICESTGATLDYLILGRASSLPNDLFERLSEMTPKSH